MPREARSKKTEPATEEAPVAADPMPAQDTPTPVSAVQMYQFKTYWGGDAWSPGPPQIHAGLIALRKAIGGLQAKKQANGPQFAVKSAKDLGIKLRDALDETGLVCFVVGQQGGNLEVEKGTAAYVQTLIRVGAPDGSYVDFAGSGHGADRDDKAGGKASTYAWKDALVKGLNLPDAEMVDTDDEVGNSPVRKQATPLPSKEEVEESLRTATAETLPDLITRIRTVANGAGAAGMTWGMALSPAVQDAKVRLGLVSGTK